MTARQRYLDRMKRVLDHIDAHLDEDCTLDTLSGVAAFSPHHFHRQFTATFGLSTHRYVQLARLRRASFRLAFRQTGSVTETALEAGYDAPDAFARAFRRRFGQAPSAFRAEPDWTPWHAAMHPLVQARSLLMTSPYRLADVTVRTLDPVRVAVMTHRGPIATIHDTVRRFISWRQEAGLVPPASATYNLFPCDPHTTPPDAFRMDLAAGTEQPVAPNDAGVTDGIIPGGRRAVLSVRGEDLEAAAVFLYREWLPQSGEAPGDFPLYARRLRFFPDVPEHESESELYLPLR